MNGWFQRMIQTGVITGPQSKASHPAIDWMDQVISEGGQNTGALSALIIEREDGR
jgi:hypothetical protein